MLMTCAFLGSRPSRLAAEFSSCTSDMRSLEPI